MFIVWLVVSVVSSGVVFVLLGVVIFCLCIVVGVEGYWMKVIWLSGILWSVSVIEIIVDVCVRLVFSFMCWVVVFVRVMIFVGLVSVDEFLIVFISVER